MQFYGNFFLMENRKNIFLFSIKNRKNRKNPIFAEKREKTGAKQPYPLNFRRVKCLKCCPFTKSMGKDCLKLILKRFLAAHFENATMIAGEKGEKFVVYFLRFLRFFTIFWKNVNHKNLEIRKIVQTLLGSRRSFNIFF